MLSHCAPLLIFPTPDLKGESIYANATVSLIDAGEIRLLVTCAHVFEEFTRYRKQQRSAVLAAIFRNGPGYPIPISERSLVECGSGPLDIATFRAHPEDWDMGYKEFFRIYSRRGGVFEFRVIVAAETSHGIFITHAHFLKPDGHLNNVVDP